MAASTFIPQMQKRAIGGSRFLADQRSETRFSIDKPATLGVEGLATTYIVTILDVSSNGVRVSCPEEVAEGAWVHVRLWDIDVPGEVRYTHETSAGEFHLGIRTSADRSGELLTVLRRVAA